MVILFSHALSETGYIAFELQTGYICYDFAGVACTKVSLKTVYGIPATIVDCTIPYWFSR